MLMKGIWEKGLTFLVRYKYLCIVIVLGIVLLLWPSGTDQNAESKGGQNTQSAQFSVSEMEGRLETALMQVKGVGQVHVMLTLKTDMEVVLSQEESSSQRRSMENGELAAYDAQNDSKPITISGGTGGQQPVVVGHIYPQYQGAMVVCEGADNTQVKLNVVNAVAALTGLGSDKITVIPMEHD